MPTTTTTYSFNKPVVGADEDDWGGYLNGNWDSVDDLLDGTTPITGIDINSGTLDGVTIGGTTAGAGTFTTLTANTSITGTLATAAQANVTSLGTLTGLTIGGNLSVDGGTIKLDGNYPTGTNNVALGDGALVDLTSGGNNTSVGADSVLGDTTTGSQNVGIGTGSIRFNTTGSNNSAVGWRSLFSNLTASSNSAFGSSALYANTTGDNGAAFGHDALRFNTTGASNSAFGRQALFSNTTASNNTAVGYQAGYSNTTGTYNAFLSRLAGYANTTGSYNTMGGSGAGINNTTGGANTVFGADALFSNTTASNNTAVGYQAGFSNTTGVNNIFIGQGAGFSATTANYNTIIGQGAGTSLTTGSGNCFVGGSYANSGYFVTTGSKNTILGGYNGNQGGLDIRTSSNYIVLSDGDGNPRQVIDSSGNLLVGKTSSSFSTVGARLSSTDNQFVTDGQLSAAFNRKTSDGDIIGFFKDGTVVGSIRSNSGARIAINSEGSFGLLQSSNSSCFFWSSLSFSPFNDNVRDLGEAGFRYDDIYATNGTIQTSDQNEKQQIASLTDAEMTAAKAISKLFKTFKWNDSVAEKGDAARTHSGVIAQDVEQAMTDAGLNAGDYAFFISSTWWETQTEVPAVEADEENGVEAQEAYTRTDTYETAEEAPEGATERNRKGIRYPQLLSFIGAATEQRLASIESRLDALENA